MTNPKIAFIGGGNMAASLVGGLVADGWDPDRIAVAEPNNAQREQLRARFPIHTGEDNVEIAASADIVVLAVKPQVLKDVATALSETIRQNRPMIISIAAGIRSTDIDRWLGGDNAIVRTMPNTPSLVNSGATGLYANDKVSEEQYNQAESVMRAVGTAIWVDDEAQLDAVTAVSGSGPAYFFLVMEAMEAAGIQLGLPEKTARLLTLETALGAARMALASDDDPATLRDKVTSPGGTTAAALQAFEEGRLRELFHKALTSARDRAVELADILGKA